MTTYYIVKYHQTNPPRIMAFTHDLEAARALCSHPDTKKIGKWFYGWTQFPPCKISKAGYPSAGDLLKALSHHAE